MFFISPKKYYQAFAVFSLKSFSPQIEFSLFLEEKCIE